MIVYRARAPAKVNLGLFVGPPRAHDGRHEIATVMQSISLADHLTLGPARRRAAQDEVFCPGVEGENLAAAALRDFRAATGWRGPPVCLQIAKRIPLAAGLAGGSADAAAALRLARAASGLGDDRLLRELAGALGADVPAQLSPGRWLAGGAGELLERLPDPGTPLGVLLLPLDAELTSGAVYAEADRLAARRSAAELERLRGALGEALSVGAPLACGLCINDLQAAALSLCPAIDDALRQARAAGAAVALVSGSGPTVAGLFAGPDGPSAARRAARRLADRKPRALVARAVGGRAGRPRRASQSAP